MLLPVVKVNYFFARKIFFLPAEISGAITSNYSVCLSPEQLLQVVELGATNPKGIVCLMARLSQELCDYALSLLVQTVQAK